jgi:Kef-type K+ transport system membrane component KefB
MRATTQTEGRARYVRREAELINAVAVADIALILLLAVLFMRLAEYLRQPPVIGEIVAGIIMGPSLLGLLPGQLTEMIFPNEARPHLALVAEVGLLLFMFGVGWKFDTGVLRYHSRSVAVVAVSSMVLPFLLALGLALPLYHRHSEVNGQHVSFTSFALYLGVAMSITAFPVLARIIADARLQNTRSGLFALGGAAIGDVLAWCVLAIVVATVNASGFGSFLATLGYLAIYVAMMALLVRPALQWLLTRPSKGPKQARLAMVVAAGVFLSSFATSLIGVHAIFGAFAFGLVMPRSPAQPLRAGVLEPLERASFLLLPVFFTLIGLSVDIASLDGGMLVEFLVITLIASAGKLLGAGLSARLSGLSWRDAANVGVLMNTRGATELIVLNIGVGLGVLDGQLFTVMVLMALVTTSMAGVLLPKHAHAVPPAADPATNFDTTLATAEPPADQELSDTAAQRRP